MFGDNTMMSISEYFLANLGTNIAYTILALIIAFIFVIVLEKYFNITLKNPVNVKFPNNNPVGRIPKIKNPMRK